MADDLRLYLRAVEAIDWTKVQTQREEEHYADWFLVDHKVLLYAGEPEDQTIEFLRRAPAAIRQLIAEVEAWRERAERAEAELVENEGVIKVLRRQRDEAEATIARVRRLCELTIAASCRVQAIDQARDTLAALDSQEADRDR